MRTVRVHAPRLEPRDYPGVAPGRLLWLESELQAMLPQARAAGVPWSSIVVHVDGDAARIRSRAEVAAELRAAGVRQLAKSVERTPVPRGAFLAFLDFDGLTLVHAVSIAEALGEVDA